MRSDERVPATDAPPPNGLSEQRPDPLIGRVINGRFRVINHLARGGMGRVYRAEQAGLGRIVALKVLDPGYGKGDDPDFQKRFLLEASTASKLRHPNTVTIFDYGRTDDDIYFIAMELLEGRTLQEALVREAPLKPERVIFIACEIARSLREAHLMGVVHRDLKPANIYLVRHDGTDDRESIKVLDFGLVKSVDEGSEQLTKTGSFMGSPRYMAPEQIRDEPPDPRVDVYGLGIVMFEMLTGRTPFERSSPINTLMAHLADPVPWMNTVRPGVEVPPALEGLVRTCLEKSADDRFSNMNDMIDAMRHCAGASSNLTLSGDYPLASGAPSGPSGVGRAVAVEILQKPGSVPMFSQTTRTGMGLGQLFLAGVFALTGIGGFVVLTRPFDTVPESTPVAEQRVVVTPNDPQEGPRPARRAGEEAPDLKRVVVTLRTTPPGAMVFVGESKYGPTPTHIVWTGADAVDGRQVTFRFELRGYQSLTLAQAVHGDRLVVDAPPFERAVKAPPR